MEATLPKSREPDAQAEVDALALQAAKDAASVLSGLAAWVRGERTLIIGGVPVSWAQAQKPNATAVGAD